MVKKLTKSQVEAGFRTQFKTTNPSQQPKPLVLTSDATVELPSKSMFDDIYSFVQTHIPDGSTYTEIDLFDCDDFSNIFKGIVSKWYQETRSEDLPLAIGTCWGIFHGFGDNQIHAMNWVILDDGLLRWIEPQLVRTKPQSKTMRLSEKSTDFVNLVMV